MKLLTAIKRSKNKDSNAFQVLFELFYSDVYKTSYFITQDFSLAEDATQEAFCKAFQKLDTLREFNKFGSWIKTIAARCAIDIMRKRQHFTVVEDFAQFSQDNYVNSLPQLLPENELEKNELKSCIKRAIYDLNPIYRQVIVMKYFLNLTSQEIADALDLPVGTVKSRLFRALNQLKISLQDENNSLGKEESLQ
ncbi:RNA polymerase, sigma-24 subunit, ECF subfamily [Tepidanaerobacter acetatoxydans Re1]|uniref:RNA polymerase, sigma-24 subunit, ECF subfamily n=1 Tax=Tepidanaerobacter acetatoxydans (strain DSM 21804 / JCM 16047 / Re1) TaxID=1209989 RepID=F4LW22_TEPAE|nr:MULTISPECIES: sigma-70 family RNA polymerase sigma factor [Tepidanaerobacter]AEE91690.1 RNA polymerase, sigma-24 subunit, ECF subfamily [Tepidanaerobacter acetatoxydans Re1]CCP26439.1 RNA polymerase, sigma-24 subunit, ECF subfamily [Tepidanaerobacter acetatoxydans Re1]